jgi:hypothetical protein
MSNIKSVIGYDTTNKIVSPAGIYWSYMHKLWPKRDYHTFQCVACRGKHTIAGDMYVQHIFDSLTDLHHGSSFECRFCGLF